MPHFTKTVSESNEVPTIIAERFKTRLCKTFRKTGECAYFVRCMFAHGKEDLRTTERNVADGLVTEAAVKNWQRAKARAEEKASKQRRPAATKVMSAAQPAPSVSSACESTVDDQPCPTTAAECAYSVSIAADPLIAAFAGTPPVSLEKAAPRTPVRRYRHDPYAQFSAWQPLLESASDSAEATFYAEVSPTTEPSSQELMHCATKIAFLPGAEAHSILLMP